MIFFSLQSQHEVWSFTRILLINSQTVSIFLLLNYREMLIAFFRAYCFEETPWPLHKGIIYLLLAYSCRGSAHYHCGREYGNTQGTGEIPENYILRQRETEPDLGYSNSSTH